MTEAMVGGAVVYLIYRWYQNQKQASQSATATRATPATATISGDGALAGQEQSVGLRVPASGGAMLKDSRHGSSGQAEEQGPRGKVMATAAAIEQAELRDTWAPVTAWFREVFKLNPQGVNWGRGVMVLDVMLVPPIVCAATAEEMYVLSAIFGVLFAALIDPGGSYWNRTWHIAVFGLVGAGVTAGGFALATSGWGWLVLATFGVTLVAGLVIAAGVHRYVAANLLNIWFVLALALGASLHSPHVHSHTWAQVVAWVAGTGLWIAITFIAWLIQGRKDRPPPFPEIPGDTSPRKLTPPLILFALLRALGMAGAAAFAFGSGLSHAYWAAIVTISAMQPDLYRTTVVGEQRVIGAAMGAFAAILLLLILTEETGLKKASVAHALEAVAIVLIVHAVAVRFWNYAFYTAGIAAGVLVLVDLPHPGNYSTEGDRVLWTLVGVGIAVLVMLFAALLSKLAARRAKAQPQPG